MPASALSQQNWPRFRGANADGVAQDDPRLPEVWDTSTNVKWMADVPGWGWSSPIVWGNRVFLTSVVSEEENIRPQKGLYRGEGVRDPAKGVHHWMVFCFDRDTGAVLWKLEAHTGNPYVPRHPKNTYAAETPTTDGERLYVLFGDLGLYCLNLSGHPVWSYPIEPKKTFMDYGAAASPVVHDGQVFVVYDNMETSWIAAFDARTGQVRWKQPREETHSWATPFVWRNERTTEMVVPGKNRNRSYSLSGEVLWEFDGRMSNLVIPSPFAAHGLCYISSGYVGDAHRPTFAIRPGATGDITPKSEQDYADSPYIEWYQPKASPYNTSPIVYGDYFYTLYDQGFLTCHNARTGELIYDKERIRPLASFTASPWAYNGYLFCLSEDGETFVLQTGPEFELITSNNLDELCLATPAIADGKLFIRTASKLYCISGGARAQEVTSDRPSASASAQPMDIWTAAREGNHDALIRSLNEGRSVNAKDPQEGNTPLYLAVLFGRTEIVKVLLEKGADVAIANRDGNTALHVASFLANIEHVDLLLNSGASTRARNAQGETPVDVVASDWSAQLEALYGYVSGLIGTDLDLVRIRQTRPRVAQILRDHTEASPIGSSALRQAKTDLHAAIDSGQAAGAAHLVVHNGRTVHWEAAGVSDIEDQTPFRKDALVRIYSMTKPITSVAAMLLYEEGKFQLDDPVATFIPAFARTTVLVQDGDTNKIVPANRPITVRDVFRHTTGYSYGEEPAVRPYYEREGLRYHGTLEMFPPEMTIEKAAETLARVPALHHPGERFTYGFNTDLLGRLIEVWSGKSLDEFLRDRIFEPLEMVDTAFSVPPDKRQRLTSCHTWRDGKLAVADKAADSPFNEGFEFLSGGGGLISTMQDYAHFCQMLVQGGRFKGKRLLQEETIQLMFTDQLNGVADDFRFGLGFAIGEVALGTGDRQRQARQYSWGGYASTDFRLVPEEKLFQIVLQQRVPTFNGLANKLFSLVYAGFSSKTRATGADSAQTAGRPQPSLSPIR